MGFSRGFGVLPAATPFAYGVNGPSWVVIPGLCSVFAVAGGEYDDVVGESVVSIDSIRLVRVVD